MSMSMSMTFIFRGEFPPKPPTLPMQQTLLSEILINTTTIANAYYKYPSYKHYIRWLEYCISNGCSALDSIQRIENKHTSILSSVFESSPGCLGILQSDYEDIVELLKLNDGSRSSITEICQWCLNYSHSILAVFQIFLNFVQSCIHHHESFNKLLHTVLVINEILSQQHVASTRGPYTHIVDDFNQRPIHIITIIWPHLVYIVNSIYKATISLPERDRIIDLIDSWVSKDVISPFQYDSLRNTITNDRIKLQEPPLPIFTSPVIQLRPPEPPRMAVVKPSLNVETMPVGRLADWARGGLNSGQERYDPIETFAFNISPTADPARLQRSISEFVGLMQQRQVGAKDKRP